MHNIKLNILTIFMCYRSVVLDTFTRLGTQRPEHISIRKSETFRVFVLGVFFATAHSMWNLSSPTRDRTRAPALEAQSPNHWTTREVP